jgi:catechol 2,3-dioxygenase-like lactoylglutathione lyase family enzyme
MSLPQRKDVLGGDKADTDMINFLRYDHALLTFTPGKEDALKHFYGEVLGLQEVPGNHPGGAIWYLIAGTEIHFAAEEPGVSSRRHLAFEVGDLAVLKEILEAAGIEPTYSSKIEGRERFFVRDPFGNRLEFLAYR